MKGSLVGLLLFSCPLYAEPSREEVFNEIYRNGYWTENGFSRSGSEFFVTRPYIEFIQSFLLKCNITTVVDLGCGDWQALRHIDWSGIEYVGYDVVKIVIDRNQMLFAQPSIRFIHADGLEIDLPQADLLICKDVLQHLSNTDVKQLLQQISKYKYCLFTDYIDRQTLSSDNTDISVGGYRPIDITMPPFNIKGDKVLFFEGWWCLKQVVLYTRPDH